MMKSLFVFQNNEIILCLKLAASYIQEYREGENNLISHIIAKTMPVSSPDVINYFSIALFRVIVLVTWKLLKCPILSIISSIPSV